jgi:hypothetical protein
MPAPDERTLQQRVKEGYWVDSEEKLQPLLDAAWAERNRLLEEGSVLPSSGRRSWFMKNRNAEWNLFWVHENLEAIRGRDAWRQAYTSDEEQRYRTAEARYLVWYYFPDPVLIPADENIPENTMSDDDGTYRNLWEYVQGIRKIRKEACDVHYREWRNAAPCGVPVTVDGVTMDRWCTVWANPPCGVPVTISGVTMTGEETRPGALDGVKKANRIRAAMREDIRLALASSDPFPTMAALCRKYNATQGIIFSGDSVDARSLRDYHKKAAEMWKKTKGKKK